MNKYEKTMMALPSLTELIGYWIGIDDAIRLGQGFVPIQVNSGDRVTWIHQLRAAGVKFLVINEPDYDWGPNAAFGIHPVEGPLDLSYQHLSKCPAWRHYRKGGKFLEQI